MSELTPCNFCSLRYMRKNKPPKARITTKAGKEDWEGWIVVTRSDRDAPIAYFKELTDHCVC